MAYDPFFWRENDNIYCRKKVNKTNLLEETVDILKNNGKTANDVLCIAVVNEKFCVEKCCNWEKFVEIAESVEYEQTPGPIYLVNDRRPVELSRRYVNINRDLVIIGDDWWLSRVSFTSQISFNSYEKWVFITTPKLLEHVKDITKDDIFKISLNPTYNSNFLEKTVSGLNNYDKTASDVLYIGIINRNGCVEKCCNWEQFVKFTETVQYRLKDISPNLIVVGNNWWLSREGYDSEWWKFNTTPKLSADTKPMQQNHLFFTNIESVHLLRSVISRREDINLYAEKYEVPPDFYTPLQVN